MEVSPSLGVFWGLLCGNKVMAQKASAERPIVERCVLKRLRVAPTCPGHYKIGKDPVVVFFSFPAMVSLFHRSSEQL